MPPRRKPTKTEEISRKTKEKKKVLSSSSDEEEEKRKPAKRKKALTSSSESEEEKRSKKTKKIKGEEDEELEEGKGENLKKLLRDTKTGKKIYWFWADDDKGQQDIWRKYSKELSEKLELCHQKRFNTRVSSSNKKDFYVSVGGKRFVDLSDEPYLQRREEDPSKRRLVKRTVGEDLDNKPTASSGNKLKTSKDKVIVSDSSSSSDSDSDDDDDDDEYVQWYWAGDSGGGPSKGGGHQDIWVEYDKKMCNKLERAWKQMRKKVKVDDERFVDLRNMLQRRHDDHMKRRSVKRGDVVKNKRKTRSKSKKPNKDKPKKKKVRKSSSGSEEERELASSDEESSNTQSSAKKIPSGPSTGDLLKAPNSWTVRNSMDYYEEDVPSTSQEFQNISQMFVNTVATYHRTSPNHRIAYRSFSPLKLVRVQNPFLWMRYHSRKQKIKEDNLIIPPVNGVATGPCQDPTVNEFFLFHGLNSNTIPGITRFGFDPRFCSLQGMFGAGLYFAENSSKSNQYCHSGNCTLSGPNATSACRCLKTDEVKMLVCRVTLGDCLVEKIYRGNMSAKDYWYGRRTEPPKPGLSKAIYNSVLGESIANGGTTLQLREYIVYESSQVYPEYILTFKRI